MLSFLRDVSSVRWGGTFCTILMKAIWRQAWLWLIIWSRLLMKFHLRLLNTLLGKSFMVAELLINTIGVCSKQCFMTSFHLRLLTNPESLLSQLRTTSTMLRIYQNTICPVFLDWIKTDKKHISSNWPGNPSTASCCYNPKKYPKTNSTRPSQWLKGSCITSRQ